MYEPLSLDGEAESEVDVVSEIDDVEVSPEITSGYKHVPRWQSQRVTQGVLRQLCGI